LYSEPTEHVDQRLDAEEMQPAPQEIANAGLTHLQQLCELRLLEPSRCRDLLDLDQKVSSDHEVLGLMRREAEIAKHVPAGRCDF
jgi:hypothetical protein